MKLTFLERSELFPIREKIGFFRRELYSIKGFLFNKAVRLAFGDLDSGFYKRNWYFKKVAMTETEIRDFFEKNNYLEITRIYGVKKDCEAMKIFYEQLLAEDYINFLDSLIQKLDGFLVSDRKSTLTFEEREIQYLTSIEKMIKDHS